MNISWKQNAHVAIVRAVKAEYPNQPPFHPPDRYPELTNLPEFSPDATNVVYPAMRELLVHLSGIQPGPGWNPLAGLIQPGDTVVLKPNFIKEQHETRPNEWEQVITHGSVIRAVCDYVLLALNGKGKVIICDAPQTDSSFTKICRVSGTQAVVDWYREWAPVPVTLVDLRKEEWEARDDVIVRRTTLKGDPEGYVAVNLGSASEFYTITPAHGFYGADYETGITAQHHHDDVHEYLLSGTVMKADVVINLPKLKTHKKTGITCSVKNLVGINGDKNWLPHYMLGSPESGGDQFPRGTVKSTTERVLMTWFKKKLYYAPVWLNHLFRPLKKLGMLVFGSTHRIVRSGNWHGNDTTWRMATDLNKCFFYWKDGVLSAGNSRRYLTIVDGIIAGEGDGPLAPDAKACGVLVGGMNPIAADTVCAWLMGFDYTKLRCITGAFSSREMPLVQFKAEDIRVTGNDAEWQGMIRTLNPESTFSFKPHFGWTGAIERKTGKK